MYNFDMKKIFLLISIIPFIFLISCGSTKIEDKNQTEEEVQSPVYEDDDEIEDVFTEYSEEYIRSTKDISSNDIVSVEEFENDKAAILEIINELSEIMRKKDKEKWISYIDPESIEYYSKSSNLRKVREKLPNKQIQLHGIGDYFKYVFIPAREKNQVDEIRYISKTNIKAVEVKSDGTELVYYYFVKKDGKWYVNIPKLDD